MLVCDFREQGQHRQADEKPLRCRSTTYPEDHPQCLALGRRKPFEMVEHGRKHLMQRRERQLHLGFDPHGACDLQVRRGLDGVLQQRRLADAGLASHDQRVALALAKGREHIVEPRALDTAPAQARQAPWNRATISHETDRS
jgi:hypothetical protein